MSDGWNGYLLAAQLSELERFQIQAQVWEPSGRSLLQQLPEGAGWLISPGHHLHPHSELPDGRVVRKSSVV